MAWQDWVKNGMIYTGILAVGYGARSCVDGISQIDPVDFPGGDKGVIVERLIGDIPFVEKDGIYVRYDESEVLRRLKNGGK